MEPKAEIDKTFLFLENIWNEIGLNATERAQQIEVHYLFYFSFIIYFILLFYLIFFFKKSGTQPFALKTLPGCYLSSKEKERTTYC